MQSGSTPMTPDYFSNVQTPGRSELDVQLEMLVEQGAMTPEEAATILQGPSAMNGITLDPKLKEQQMASLAALDEIAQSGGMTAMDKANLSRISNEENAQARGQREAILQNAQARGMGGSGLELMSNMVNQQESVNRKSQRDLDVAALAQQRALDAIMQGGQLAGDIRGQDFGQAAQVAGANDAISQFNARNQQNQINMNTGARNDAQQFNLANKQNTANANVGLRNQQAQSRANVSQQMFENEMKKRSGQAGIGMQNAQAQGQNSQNAANANNQLIGGLMGVGTAGISAYGGPKKKPGEL